MSRQVKELALERSTGSLTLESAARHRERERERERGREGGRERENVGAGTANRDREVGCYLLITLSFS